jgi:hypothetical protein
MKRFAIFLACISLSLSGYGQQKLEVIASAGGYNVAPGGAISISWTLGETIIPDYTVPGVLSIVHGFQQRVVITEVEMNIESPVSVNVYPNPVSDIVKIEFEQPVDIEVKGYLIDSRGSMVKIFSIGAGTVVQEVSMENLPAGLYYLRLQKGKFANVYRVVKL